MPDFLDSRPYVRLAEAVFAAEITEALYAEGEWRYAWAEQAFDPRTGAYSAASPGRSGTAYVNYATELRGREAPVPRLVWMRLKDSVGQQQVYEFVDGAAGDQYRRSYTAPTWNTTQNDYDPPDDVSLILLSSSASVSLTGASVEEDRLLVWTNTGNYPVIIPHQSASSTTGNRWTTPTTTSLVLRPGDSMTTIGTTVAETTSTLVRLPGQDTITTQLDDYPPEESTTVFVLASAPVDLTGLVPPSTDAPWEFTIVNSPTSDYDLTLISQSTSSTTSYRFDLPADWVVPPGTSVTLVYDVDSSRWVVRPQAPPPPWRPTLTGTNNNVPRPFLTTALVPTLTAATTITGVADLEEGSLLVITNPAGSSYDLTLANNSGSSSVGNRFDFSTGADVTLSPGESLTVVYDGSKIVDAGSSLSLSSGTPYTDEAAQDAVGGILADTDTVDATYSDGTPSITFDVRKQMSVTSDASGLKLVGDSSSPGNSKLYGTDGSGNKGWYSQPSASVGAEYPGWVKVSKTYSDLSAASTSNNVEVYSLPAKGVIHGVVIKHTAAFTGGSISAYTLSVGYGSSPNEFTQNLDAFAAPSATAYRANNSTYQQMPKPYDFTSATSVRLYANSVGANLSAATQGSVEVWLCVATLP